MMFLTNTTPTKQARNMTISVWSKEAIGKLSYMVVGYVTLGNAIIDMDRCCFKIIGCKVLSLVRILLAATVMHA